MSCVVLFDSAVTAGPGNPVGPTAKVESEDFVLDGKA